MTTKLKLFIVLFIVSLWGCNQESVEPTKEADEMGNAASNDKLSDFVGQLSSAGLVSSGTSNDLDAYRGLYSFIVASGVQIEDIVGIGIAGSNDHCYVWYKDGTVSAGTSNDLDKYRTRYTYTLAPGKTPYDIVGMGIAGSNDHCYVWYKDGTVSSGTSNDLDRYRSRYVYTLAPGKSPSQILGMGIAGSNDHCYVWYRD